MGTCGRAIIHEHPQKVLAGQIAHEIGRVFPNGIEPETHRSAEMEGDFDKARATIHNTPAARRSEFAKEIWRRRQRAGSGLELVRMLTGA